jgi:predicted PurR-regulated permease PerM
MAAAFSAGSMILIVVPIVLLTTVLIGQVQDLMGVALRFLEHSETFLRSDGFENMATKLTELSGGSLDLRSVDLSDQVGSFLANYSERIISISAGLLRNIAGFLVALAFFLFVLFFLYLDGKELILMLMNAIPLRNEYTVSFMRKFRDTGKELAIGYVLMALFQGIMALVVYGIMKVPAPVPLALLTAIASLVPLVGTGLVWFPLVLLRFASGMPGEALLFLALSVVFISSLDNFIRPFLLHARMKLHPLLIFISIIGGIQYLGLNGLLLGPIILVLFFSAVDMFGKAYGNPARSANPGNDPLSGQAETGPG